MALGLLWQSSRALLLLGVAFLLPGTPASAATITVETLADSDSDEGDCTLREAIQNANANDQSGSIDCDAGSGQDSIGFSVSGSILLGSTLPSVADPSGLLIDGQNSITLDGQDAVRILFVGSGGVLELRHLTVKGAHANFGAGILNNGTLTVLGSNFSNNRCNALGNGAGIDNNGGTVTVQQSTFSQNQADSGAAIINRTGTLKVQESTFSNNVATGSPDGSGGGIFNNGGTVTVQQSTFLGNGASRGSGIHNFNGTVTVQQSSFSSNSGSLGGGINNLSGPSGATLTVQQSTFSGNSSSEGGGIRNSGTLEISNSTFFANRALIGASGVDVFNVATLRVYNSTFTAGGTNGSSSIHSPGTAALSNVIVANASTGPNCSGGTFIDGGGNLADDSSCSFTQPNSKNDTPAGLDPNGPQDHGGPTSTIELLSSSAAIDMGDPNTCADPNTVANLDQRGISRPLDGDGSGTATCDIGAFEAPAMAVNTPTPTPVDSPTPTPSSTATQAPTSSPTPTAQDTPTPTPPAATPTTTATPTATRTPSGSPVISPTAAASSTATSTPAAGASPTPSPSTTPPAPEATLTPTITLTPTLTATVMQTSAITQTATVTRTPPSPQTPAATRTPTGTLTPNLLPSSPGSGLQLLALASLLGAMLLLGLPFRRPQRSRTAIDVHKP